MQNDLNIFADHEEELLLIKPQITCWFSLTGREEALTGETLKQPQNQIWLPLKLSSLGSGDGRAFKCLLWKGLRESEGSLEELK